mgnify:CR=1 FL=1
MTHAITLLLITLFFGRLAGLIPMATLGAILVIVAYNMSEWRTFVSELRGPKSDVAVLVTTGSTRPEQVETFPYRPTRVVDSIKDLVGLVGVDPTD